VTRIEETMVNPSESIRLACETMQTAPLTAPASLATLLRRPDLDYASLAPLDPAHPKLSAETQETVESEVKYAGYLRREAKRADEAAQWESTLIPASVEFSTLQGLSREVREKLIRVRPRTVGQARRIPGMTPAALNLLLVHVKRNQGTGPQDSAAVG
jgi:tRNA uridine 5-carboxymethylaminomethyl modification enzyme